MFFDKATLRRIVFAVTLPAAIAGHTPATALEFLGFTFFEKKKNEPDVVDPHRYTVKFDIAGIERDTPDAKKLRAASRLFVNSGRPTSGPAGLVRLAHEDYARILAALFDQGRYGGSVSILLAGREAADVSPIDPLPDPTEVVVKVDPGVVFRFGEVQIFPQAAPNDKFGDKVANPAEKGFVTGDLAFAGRIRDAQDLSVEAWRQQGHALAKVADLEVIADHATARIDATVLLDPGPKLRFADVQVSGGEAIDHDFLVYMADLPKGQEFDPDDVEDAKERFVRLGVFRSVVVREEASQVADGEIPISISVNDRKPRRISFGANISSVDGVGLEALWMHRNLFGKAQQLRLDGRVSGVNDIYLSDGINYFLGAELRFPGTLDPDSDFFVKLEAERADFDTYLEESLTASTGFTRVFSPVLTGDAAVTYAVARFTDGLGIRNFKTLGVESSLTYDVRDIESDASEGYYLKAEVRPTYELEFDHLGLRATIEGRAYRSLMPDDKIVLAGRLKLGAFVGSAINETSPDNLFFTGGGSSVRGYSFNSIGITLPNGSVVGGNTLIEGNLEFRFRFNERFGGVAFADFGLVDSEPLYNLSASPFVGLGIGFRYYTTLGPIRIDVAIPQQKRNTDSDYVLYIGIGQAF